MRFACRYWLREREGGFPWGLVSRLGHVGFRGGSGGLDGEFGLLGCGETSSLRKLG